jgi:hypothetical protein
LKTLWKKKLRYALIYQDKIDQGVLRILLIFLNDQLLGKREGLATANQRLQVLELPLLAGTIYM